MSRSGGCQCGAVRFRVEGELGRASICHCRMCQKAFGGFFGPLVSVQTAGLTWTRGAPARFQSSNKAARGFCAACGTPLTFEWSDKVIDLAIGAFDEPEDIAPAVQLAVDRRLPYVEGLARLPERAVGLSDEGADYLGVVSHQHPDEDTEVWPPR
ncbi:MAG: GFA family protein [Caulobacterales bacterium]|nr:GFA family protein [Caulobacterales bacterium]